MKQFLILSMLASVLAGCSSGTAEVSKSDDATAKTNFTRSLTPEEQAKMNGGSAPGKPAPGAPPVGGPP